MLGAPGASFCGMYLPKVMEEKKWAGQDLEIRVLWCCNGNMLSCESGRQDLIDAVKKIDFVVCADVNMTDTAQWADILLPVPIRSRCRISTRCARCRIPRSPRKRSIPCTNARPIWRSCVW